MRPNLAPCRPVPARVALIAALALTALAVSGCVGVPTKTVTITRTIEQTAAVIAPSPPKGSMPLRPKQVAFEGGFSFAIPLSPERTRYEGADANTYNDKSLHGRFALSPSEHVDFGFAFEFAHHSWGSATAATDVNAGEIEGFNMYWSVTPHLALFPIRNDIGGFGFNLEADLTQIAHRRDVYEKAYVTTYTGGIEDKTENIGRRITSRSRANFYPIFRLGLIGFGHIGDLTLAGGVAVQNMPVFFGTTRADFQCTYYDALNDPDGQPDYLTCQGVQDTDSIDPYRSTVVSNLHLSAAYTLGRVVLQGQLSSALSGDKNYQILPFRVDFAVRFAFEAFTDEAPSEDEIRRLYNAPDGDGDGNPTNPTDPPPAPPPKPKPAPTLVNPDDPFDPMNFPLNQ